jgi:hypothetical protein
MTATACWRANHRPYPPSGNGRADARATQRVPNAGGSPSRVRATRSRVATPSTPSTSTTTCQPVAIGRGSPRTVSSSSAHPPVSTSAGSRPCSVVAIRAPAATAETATTASSVSAATPPVTRRPPRRRAWTTREIGRNAAPTVPGHTHRNVPGDATRATTISASRPPHTAATAHAATGPTTAPRPAVGGPAGTSPSGAPTLTRRPPARRGPGRSPHRSQGRRVDPRGHRRARAPRGDG